MSSTTSSDIELKELEYRRKKQWDIFSWCSTILVALTGGVIVLQTREHAYQLHTSQKIAISISVIAIMVYAMLWLSYNWTREQEFLKIFDADETSKPAGNKRPYFGYRGAILLLSVGALLATWLPS